MKDRTKQTTSDKILAYLNATTYGQMNVGRIAADLGLTVQVASAHLVKLFEAKILSREKQGTSTIYSINKTQPV